MTKKDEGRSSSQSRHDPVAAGLRKLWQGVEQEPIPAELLALLDRIERQRSGSDGGMERSS